MRPSPRSAIQRAACCVRKYGPLRLTAISSSKLSSVDSRMSRRSRGAIPALFTSRSRLWKRSRAKPISPSRSSRDARSHLRISHPVSARNDSAASRRPRYVPITLCVLARSIAMARPMPRLAPGTMLFGLGKSVVDSLRDFLESEDFDEWRAVHQRGGGVDDPAAHAFLVVLLHQLGVVRIVQRRQRFLGLHAVLAREFRHPVLEVVRGGLAVGRHGVAPVLQAKLGVLLGEEPRRDSRAPRPGVLGQRKIAVKELHPVAVLRKNPLVQHHPEVGAVRALQILIDNHTHRAARAAFDETLRRESDAGKQQSSPQTFGHMRIEVSKTKVKRVSDGTFTRWPLVTSSAPTPAAPPAPAPITAPLPPPAMAPMTA